MNDLYICPICGQSLNKVNKSFVCDNNHCFDIAKSGYVNLILPNKKNSVAPGDNKEMIVARKKVMDLDYYKKLADTIIYKLPTSSNAILDAGCGVGYIPIKVKEALPDTIVCGTDISKYAIECASKQSKEVNFAVASSLRLPYKDNFFDAVICAFAPVYGQEFNRITKKDGLLLRVVPDVYHLYDLKKFLYKEPRVNEMDPLEIDGFSFIEEHQVKSTFRGCGEIIHSLVKMTPYYYHTPKEDIERLIGLSEFTINTEFSLRIYRKV